jgi:hypothetical protein
MMTVAMTPRIMVGLASGASSCQQLAAGFSGSHWPVLLRHLRWRDAGSVAQVPAAESTTGRLDYSPIRSLRTVSRAEFRVDFA